jgi:hypothetical protein
MIYTTVKSRYPEESGYGTAFLAYNRIFDIRTTIIWFDKRTVVIKPDIRYP